MADIWLPRFLREAGVRRALTALYVGLIPSENCRLLTESTIDEIRPEEISGNSIERYCFRFSIRWLKYTRDFATNEKVFSEQFLEPMKAVARFRLTVREAAPYSMTVRGLIVVKSPSFYDQAFRDYVCTLSVLVPELNSVVALRCRKEEADKMECGEIALHGIQPIPFVNRIHPTKLWFELLKNKKDSPELSFCKVSFKDLCNLDRVLAFENFTELWSEQMYDINNPRHGRRLGAVYTLGGKNFICGNGPLYYRTGSL